MNFRHTHLSYPVIILLISTTLFMSCAENKKIDADVAKTGIDISSKMIASYQLIEQYFHDEKNQSDLVKILLSNSENLPEFKGKDYSLLIDSRIEIVRLYKKVLDDVNLLSDKRFSVKDVNLSYSTETLCDSLFLFLTDNAGKNALLDAKNSVAGKKIEKFLVLKKLTFLMNEFYLKDTKIWKSHMNHSFNELDSNINNIPITMFDIEKIAKIVNEPYSDKTALVNMYKMKLRQKSYDLKNNTIQQINSIEEILSNYELLNAELAKKKPSDKYVESQLAKISSMLK